MREKQKFSSVYKVDDFVEEVDAYLVFRFVSALLTKMGFRYLYVFSVVSFGTSLSSHMLYVREDSRLSAATDRCQREFCCRNKFSIVNKQIYLLHQRPKVHFIFSRRQISLLKRHNSDWFCDVSIRLSMSQMIVITLYFYYDLYFVCYSRIYIFTLIS